MLGTFKAGCSKASSLVPSAVWTTEGEEETTTEEETTAGGGGTPGRTAGGEEVIPLVAGVSFLGGGLEVLGRAAWQIRQF